MLCYTEILTFQTSQLQSIRHKVEEDDGVGMKGKGGVGGWGSWGSRGSSHLPPEESPHSLQFPYFGKFDHGNSGYAKTCLEPISAIHKIGALETH